MSEPIIRWDQPGDGMYPVQRERERMDEFIAKGEDIASFHFEAMGEAQFWMLVRMKDGRDFHINCGAMNDRARGYCHVEEG